MFQRRLGVSFLGALFQHLLCRQGLQQHPLLLSFWFILPDGSTRPGKPDPEESSDSSSSGGSEPEPAGHQLFCLEYEADSGEVTSVIVYQVCAVQGAVAWAHGTAVLRGGRTGGPVDPR